MNVSMHSTAIQDTQASNSRGEFRGVANFAEQHGRNGTLSMFFDSAEDCQVAADALADLAKQMKRQDKDQALEGVA